MAIYAESIPSDDNERTLVVNVTDEGVIMDAYLDGELSGTVGMTFEEWWEYVDGR